MNKITAVKIIPVFILPFFFLGVSPLELYAKALDIPSNLGTVKEVYETNSTLPNAGRTIIHIQDAHCNYEAQKNMSQILEYLVKEDNLKLIMVEGGSGDVSLSFIRNYADKKARVEVAEKYLKEGKISGEEYLNIISDYPLELYGIEDEELYDAHLLSFEKLDLIKEEGLRFIESSSNIVRHLKPRIYSEELMVLEKKKSEYEDKVISLSEYCLYLKEMIQKKGLGFAEYLQLSTFSDTAQLEEDVDFNLAESERNSLIKELAGLMDGKGMDELLLMSKYFKAKQIAAQQYYSFLKVRAEQRLNLKTKYPHLYSYINYVSLGKEVNAAELLKEVNSAEEKIKETSFINAEQRKLNEIAKSVQILTRILNLELTPEDYGYFEANKPKFLTADWQEFLTQKCSEYNLPVQPSASRVIDDNFDELDNFYKLGMAREEAFVKNLVNKMDASEQKSAVLITGGFHTPGITRMLEEKGYSYMVVTPAITQKSDSSIYFSVLRGEKGRPEEAIKE